MDSTIATILFVGTAFLSFMAMLKLLSLIFNGRLILPFENSVIDFTRIYLFGPAMIYQIWFWTNYFNLIS